MNEREVFRFPRDPRCAHWGAGLAPLLVALSMSAESGEKSPNLVSSSGTEIGRMGSPGGLEVGVEPSGVIWHPGLELLIVVGDEGSVNRLSGDGAKAEGNWTQWNLGGDLEAIALPDPNAPMVYLGVEDPDAVVEFDLVRGVLTGREWDLSSVMTGKANRGLEALAAGDGVVFAGHQGTGRIFVFALLSEGNVELRSVLSTSPERTDLSGLHFDHATDSLFALYESGDLVRQMTKDGSLIREFRVPGKDQEGLAVVGDCDTGRAVIYIAQDGGEVWRYPDHPVTCLENQPNPSGVVSPREGG